LYCGLCMLNLPVSHLRISILHCSYNQSAVCGCYIILFVKNILPCYVCMHFAFDLWLPLAPFHVFVTYLSYLLYAFFWVIPQHLNFMCQFFGTVCLFHLRGLVGMLGNYPEESIQNSEHGESLKWRISIICCIGSYWCFVSMICLLCFHFCHLYSLLFVCKPCDQKRLEVMFWGTLKHTVDKHSHILVVDVQIMAVFCIYTTVHCAVVFEFAAFIGSGEFGICNCHWLCKILNLQLSLVL